MPFAAIIFRKQEVFMLRIIVRTLIIYITLLIVMRIMGKRQLGELELSELITTLLFSEIATTPITTPSARLIDAIVPIGIIAALEILFSLIMLKFPTLKRMLTSGPSVIIQKGRINKKEMLKSRITIDELVSQIRQNGVYSLSEVDYAILEENGKISVIPKSDFRPPSVRDAGIKVKDSGVMHIIIADGKINSYNLELIGKDKKWLESLLNKQRLKPKDIFCMTVDDANNVFIQTNTARIINLQ